MSSECEKCCGSGRVKESGWDGNWIQCSECLGTGDANARWKSGIETMEQRIKVLEEKISKLTSKKAKEDGNE